MQNELHVNEDGIVIKLTWEFIMDLAEIAESMLADPKVLEFLAKFEDS